MLLALWAFALQNQVKPGPVNLPPFVARNPASGKTTNALQPQWPALFYLISSEALRLTARALFVYTQYRHAEHVSASHMLSKQLYLLRESLC
jgi:hypothetical protein